MCDTIICKVDKFFRHLQRLTPKTDTMNELQLFNGYMECHPNRMTMEQVVEMIRNDGVKGEEERFGSKFQIQSESGYLRIP